MARRIRSTFLENRTARLKLAARKKPYSALIAPGIFLAYRRNAGPGTWSVKCNGWLKRFALADDHEDANGESVMTYWQALDRAKTLARAGEGNTGQPISVAEAVDAYEADLETRGGRKYNATQLRLHLTNALKSKVVALLTERELRDWRAGLVKAGLKPSSADRIGRSLKGRAGAGCQERQAHHQCRRMEEWAQEAARQRSRSQRHPARSDGQSSGGGFVC